MALQNPSVYHALSQDPGSRASLHDLRDDPKPQLKTENILALFAGDPTKLAVQMSNENSSKLNPFDFL